jgi:hypothetical protein
MGDTMNTMLGQNVISQNSANDGLEVEHYSTSMLGQIITYMQKTVNNASFCLGMCQRLKADPRHAGFTLGIA